MSWSALAWRGGEPQSGCRALGPSRSRLPGPADQHAESLRRGGSLAREPLLEQPALQRVGTEVLADNEARPAAGDQPRQPGQQEFVQGRLADPDRRIGPDLVVAGVRFHLLG